MTEENIVSMVYRLAEAEDKNTSTAKRYDDMTDTELKDLIAHANIAMDKVIHTLTYKEHATEGKALLADAISEVRRVYDLAQYVLKHRG